MASPTDLTLLGSPSRVAAYAHYRNGSTEAHYPLLQSRMNHQDSQKHKSILNLLIQVPDQYTA